MCLGTGHASFRTRRILGREVLWESLTIIGYFDRFPRPQERQSKMRWTRSENVWLGKRFRTQTFELAESAWLNLGVSYNQAFS